MKKKRILPGFTVDNDQAHQSLKWVKVFSDREDCVQQLLIMIQVFIRPCFKYWYKMKERYSFGEEQRSLYTILMR